MLPCEPTAHLDITHQVELLGLVQKLTHRADAPVGALAALHDLNEEVAYVRTPGMVGTVRCRCSPTNRPSSTAIPNGSNDANPEFTEIALCQANRGPLHWSVRNTQL